MNDYFTKGLVLVVFALTYFYKEEKKKSLALQTELDLLKLRRNLDETDKQLTATTLPVRPVMPDLQRHGVKGNVFVGAPPTGIDSDNGDGPK